MKANDLEGDSCGFWIVDKEDMNVSDLSCDEIELILSTDKHVRLVKSHPYIPDQRISRKRHHPTFSVIQKRAERSGRCWERQRWSEMTPDASGAFRHRPDKISGLRFENPRESSAIT